jgi:4-amino-4-deoxy-L-arabinose transferase-like glycosyltransferase
MATGCTRPGSMLPKPAFPDDVALSIVVPAHDEAPNLERLLREVRAALDPTGIAWELIVADDDSTDDTPAILERLAAADQRLRPVHLPRRRGQTAALQAGLRAARGPLLATLDADLQCPPSALPDLLAALGDADLACGVRAAREDPLPRRLTSAFSNLVRRCLLAPRLRDLACPMRVFRADALTRVEAEMPSFPGAHRWLPALFHLAGCRVVQREVAHQARTAGVSKYTATGRAGPVARELVHVLGLAWPRSRGLRIGLTLAALGAVACLYLYGLGAWPLIEPDEGRNAEVAREMLAGGRWSVPYFNGLPYLDKPVLFFWAVAAAFRALGVDEFAARLPSALAAVACVALTFAVARPLVGGGRAALAAVVFASAPIVLAFARLVIFDMLLTACVTAALYCLLQGRRTGAVWRWWPAAAGSMGLGLLCKGPVGVVVPLLAWAAARGALPPPPPRRAGTAPALVSIALFASMIAPWLARVEALEPGFLHYAVVDETLLRLTSAARFRRGAPPYFYAGVLAWAGGVWSALLVWLSPELWRRWRAGGSDACAIAFATRAAVAMVLFFTLSASKRPQYLLPAMVPLALLVAIACTAAPQRAAKALRGFGGIAAVVGLVAVIVALRGFSTGTGDRSFLTPAVAGAAGVFLMGWGVATAIVGGRPAVAVGSAVVMGPGLLLTLLHPLGAAAEARSTRALAAQVPPSAQVVGAAAFRTSLPFYLGRPVPLLSRDGHELTSNYVVAMRDRFFGSSYWLPEARLPDVVAADPAVILLAAPDAIDELSRRAGRRLSTVGSDRESTVLTPGG